MKDLERRDQRKNKEEGIRKNEHFTLCYSGETSNGQEILKNMRSWINAAALILSSLPVSRIS